MKILTKKGFLHGSMVCLTWFGLLACAETEEGPGKEISENGAIPLALRAGETEDNPDLLCSLYLFSQPKNGSGYQFSQLVSPVLSEETLLPVEEGELADQEFRFLFIATPREQNEIKIVTRSGQEITRGTPWEDILLTAGGPLTIENYYGITEMTGNEIRQAGKVEGHLSRLTGQIVFNFYKAGPGGTNDPIAVDPSRARSVFDRIYQVDITYTGQASGVAFGAENVLVPVYQTPEAQEQTFHFTLTPDLKVEVPQTENHLAAYESFLGGIRMTGACFFPTDKKLRVAMVFHYYDTTPVCESAGSNTGHLHTADCYARQEILLNLPAPSLDGLSVRPDYFTVNKAALPCDRVIDIAHASGVDIQTSWNVSNSH